MNHTPSPHLHTAHQQLNIDIDHARRLASALSDAAHTLRPPVVISTVDAAAASARDFLSALERAVTAVDTRTIALRHYTQALATIAHATIDAYERTDEHLCTQLGSQLGGQLSGQLGTLDPPPATPAAAPPTPPPASDGEKATA
ncbi:hypothetical protein [Corynebacterium aquilae]|nr:hypothetical protein [Corynebacterium aquilae]